MERSHFCVTHCFATVNASRSDAKACPDPQNMNMIRVGVRVTVIQANSIKIPVIIAKDSGE